jgi:exonuclease SbcC
MADQQRSSLDAELKRKQGLAAELESWPQLAQGLKQAESSYLEALEQQKMAQETLWGVQAKLEHLSEMELRKKEKARQLAETSREASVYGDLAKAFGKGGIQAMLIESALPEVEDEANRLLARMTDNRMHVKIETQRATKKGDTVETLDINIGDEMGTRSYEMFSGGEAFRINFALRIALSKILARRAGAPLRTLIIDEGFGTQDATGIERMREAITSIEDDFDKILVITHIEELRDAFPTRIEVVKTADGSTIQVS